MAKMFTGTDTLHDDWNVLQDEDEVQALMEASEDQPQLVYKHSHRCSICIMAKERIEESFNALSQKATMNFVNVIKSRPVSDVLTNQTGIRHESPQVLLIQNKEVIWHDSHGSIKTEKILEQL